MTGPSILLQTWFPGVLLGAGSLVYGLVVGFAAGRESGRRVVLGLHLGMTGLSALLLAIGVVLLVTGRRTAAGQAYALAGGIGLVLFLLVGTAVKAMLR